MRSVQHIILYVCIWYVTCVDGIYRMCMVRNTHVVQNSYIKSMHLFYKLRVTGYAADSINSGIRRSQQR